MAAMQHLRNTSFLARLVLVWFVLAMGVATASPLVKPQAMELVCSGSGVVKLLVKTDGGLQELGSHALDCPLCLAAGVPPTAVQGQVAPLAPSHYVLRSIPATRGVAQAAAPLPARGPPLRDYS